MQNKVEIIMDDERIVADGKYSLESVHEIIDDLFINKKGLRKEGNFYIDDDPYDSAGVGMACIFILAKKKWFRDYVKEMRWYQDISAISPNANYLIEDIKAGVIDTWDEDRKKFGLPV